MIALLKLFIKILYTLFYALGYGCFFIVSLDLDTWHQRIYYALMIPFLIVLIALVFFKIYLIWA